MQKRKETGSKMIFFIMAIVLTLGSLLPSIAPIVAKAEELNNSGVVGMSDSDKEEYSNIADKVTIADNTTSLTSNGNTLQFQVTGATLSEGNSELVLEGKEMELEIIEGDGDIFISSDSEVQLTFPDNVVKSGVYVSDESKAVLKRNMVTLTGVAKFKGTRGNTVGVKLQDGKNGKISVKYNKKNVDTNADLSKTDIPEPVENGNDGQPTDEGSSDSDEGGEQSKEDGSKVVEYKEKEDTIADFIDVDAEMKKTERGTSSSNINAMSALVGKKSARSARSAKRSAVDIIDGESVNSSNYKENKVIEDNVITVVLPDTSKERSVQREDLTNGIGVLQTTAMQNLADELENNKDSQNLGVTQLMMEYMSLESYANTDWVAYVNNLKSLADFDKWSPELQNVFMSGNALATASYVDNRDKTNSDAIAGLVRVYSGDWVDLIPMEARSAIYNADGVAKFKDVPYVDLTHDVELLAKMINEQVKGATSQELDEMALGLDTLKESKKEAIEEALGKERALKIEENGLDAVKKEDEENGIKSVQASRSARAAGNESWSGQVGMNNGNGQGGYTEKWGRPINYGVDSSGAVWTLMPNGKYYPSFCIDVRDSGVSKVMVAVNPVGNNNTVNGDVVRGLGNNPVAVRKFYDWVYCATEAYGIPQGGIGPEASPGLENKLNSYKHGMGTIQHYINAVKDKVRTQGHDMWVDVPGADGREAFIKAVQKRQELEAKGMKFDTWDGTVITHTNMLNVFLASGGGQTRASAMGIYVSVDKPTPPPPENKIGYIKFNKVDQNGNPVTGAKMSIVRGRHTWEEAYAIAQGTASGVVMDNFTSGSEPYEHLINQHSIGETWTFIETAPPSGYELSKEAKYVEIKDVNDAYVLTIVNTKIPEGEVYIQKEDPSGVPLAGAVFQVVGNGINTQVTTNSGGVARLGNLQPNTTLTITEIKAPDGYQLNSSPKTVTVPSGGMITVTFKNIGKPLESLVIVKKNAEQRIRLAGAEFKMTGNPAGGGQVEKTIVIGADGYGSLSAEELLDVLPGTYTLTEIKAPPGYKKMAQPTTFEYVAGSNNKATVDIDNELQKGKFKLIKSPEKDSDGDIELTDGTEGITGAEYDVFVKNDITIPGTDHVIKADTKVDHIATGANGEAISDGNGVSPRVFDGTSGLAPGTYYIKETKAPDGYLRDVDGIWEVTIVEEPENAQQGKDIEAVPVVKVSNKLQKGQFEVVKKGQKVVNEMDGTEYNTGEELLSGAEFDVFTATDLQIAGTGKTIPKDTKVDHVVVGSNGKGQSSMHLPGKYYFVETKAPDGYLLDKKAKNEVTITANNEEAQAGKHISEISLGEATDDVQKGKFKIIKEGETPNGVKEVKDDRVDEPLNEFTMGKTVLKDVEFDVFTREDVEIPGIDKNIPKDTLVDHMVTDEKGESESKMLVPGKYYYKETKAPEGYVLDKDKEYEVEIVADRNDATNGQHIQKVEVTTVFNELQKVELDLNKFGEEWDKFTPDEQTGFTTVKKPLKDVLFGIYTRDDIKGNTEEPIVTKDKLVGLASTDEKGIAVFTAKYPVGMYYAKELKTTDRHDINKKEFDFEVKQTHNEPIKHLYMYQDGVSEDEDDKELTPIDNAMHRHRFQIKKFVETGKQSGKDKGWEFAVEENVIAEGAVFELTREEDGEFVQNMVVGKDLTATSNELPVGTYILKETKAPNDKYSLNEKLHEVSWRVVITKDGVKMTQLSDGKEVDGQNVAFDSTIVPDDTNSSENENEEEPTDKPTEEDSEEETIQKRSGNVTDVKFGSSNEDGNEEGLPILNIVGDKSVTARRDAISYIIGKDFKPVVKQYVNGKEVDLLDVKFDKESYTIERGNEGYGDFKFTATFKKKDANAKLNANVVVNVTFKNSSGQHMPDNSFQSDGVIVTDGTEEGGETEGNGGDIETPEELEGADTIEQFKVVNYLKKGELEFSKTDITGGKEIPGAEINIKGKDTDITFVSGTKPTKFKLPDGTYTFSETLAPKGYIRTTETGTFSIIDGEITKCILKNKREKKLPTTGSQLALTLIPMLLGVVAIAGIVVIYTTRKKKK